MATVLSINMHFLDITKMWVTENWQKSTKWHKWPALRWLPAKMTLILLLLTAVPVIFGGGLFSQIRSGYGADIRTSGYGSRSSDTDRNENERILTRIRFLRIQNKFFLRCKILLVKSWFGILLHNVFCLFLAKINFLCFLEFWDFDPYFYRIRSLFKMHIRIWGQKNRYFFQVSGRIKKKYPVWPDIRNSVWI